MPNLRYIELELNAIDTGSAVYDVIIDVEAFITADGADIDGYYILDVYEVRGDKRNRVELSELPHNFTELLEYHLELAVSDLVEEAA